MLTISGKYHFSHGKSIHRTIMHEIDPRDNEDELQVHHIDGNKSNNDPSNLMWMTCSEHSRFHKTGDNHFPCDGMHNANYRHVMCVNGQSKEYKQIHNHKTYMRHREERLSKQNAYGAEHREHKRWYDKLRYWKRKCAEAETEEERKICFSRIEELERSPA